MAASAQDGGTWDRWSTHLETCISLDLPTTGVTLSLAQDPNSGNLGLTVWDASIVLAAWLDRNCGGKTEFGRARLAGKRAVDLGSGAGAAGLALALLGADVTLTDVAGVLPLLRTNADANLGPAARRSLPGGPRSAGSVAVLEYDWLRPESWEPVLKGGPADVVLMCDCVYKEAMVAPLLRALLALCGPGRKTTVLCVNEFRSQSVHEAWTAAFSQHFTWRKAPRARMHPVYQHPAIDILIMKRRSGGGGVSGVGGGGGGGASEETGAVEGLVAAAAAATLEDMAPPPPPPPTAAEP
jgi:protein N-lysine methyltransferase METTL21D